MAKKYRLLKDLPFAKAGAIFEEWTGERNETPEKTLVNKNNITTNLWINDVENFDEWFEEIQELKKYYYIGSMGHVESAEYKGWEVSLKLRKSIDNYFETKEEAEKYLEYLKAKAVIKQDTKGFKPDWSDDDEKYLGFWDLDEDKLDWLPRSIFIEASIYFKSREDIEESFEKHPEEWKTYLNYEQQTNRKKGLKYVK